MLEETRLHYALVRVFVQICINHLAQVADCSWMTDKSQLILKSW